MARCNMSLITLTLMSLLLPSLLTIHLTIAGMGDDGDEAALLGFKAGITGDGSGALAAWNSSTSFCNWEGVKCSRARSPRVVALSLMSLGLVGTLSPAIGNLTFLRSLNLSYNWFHGEIPPSIGRLRRLQALDMRDNSLSGTIPANLSFCTSMTYLHLGSNQLHGCIPPELGNMMMRLQKIELHNNSFTGPIPSSLANLSSLYFLGLSLNNFEGPIPPQLSKIRGLEVFDVFQNNLYGVLPHSLYNLSSMKHFMVGMNMLAGSIPTDIGERFPAIHTLTLSYNMFSGVIPSALCNLSNITTLALDENRFSGYIPPTLGRSGALRILDLSYNKLEANNTKGWDFVGSLTNCSQLQYLALSNNSFSGQLPNSVANLSATLQVLYLTDLGISGTIPPDLGNISGLKKLVLVNTSLSGEIPESIGKLANLIDLFLFSSSLSGMIPTSVGNLTQLNRLDASYNNLEGPIPASIGRLNKLYFLSLCNNHLNSSIPKEIFELTSLSSYLDLSSNTLSGPLPSEVGKLVNLNQLVLSGNQLSGAIPVNTKNCIVLEILLLDNNLFHESIPENVKNIKGLRILNLTMNKLSGWIPDALGSINNLQELYLEHNNLSGTIPTVLQNLELYKLDVSFNNLQGEVPEEGIFKNITYSSVAGNKDLCSRMPQLHLVPCPISSMKMKRKGWLETLKIFIALTTVGAILLLVLALALMWMIPKKLKQKQKGRFLPLEVEKYQKVSYFELSKGTDGFSEANLLGRGSYGTVYKCTFHSEDTSTITAVKVFNLQVSGSSRTFLAECEALRRVRHRCLVKIITSCSTIDHQGQNFKALIFEFMSNGSLYDWLHPKSTMPAPRKVLTLAQRLNIAVDILDALDYLHNHCQPPIIHCDLKPGNILLTADMSAQVGDFGISRILSGNTCKTLIDSISSVGIRGSIGYVAPEYGEGCAISIVGDVYSLGILLLEMFTGRSPSDDLFTDSLDLHKYVEVALPDKAMDIADPTIWLHQEANDMHSTDIDLAMSKIHECLARHILLKATAKRANPDKGCCSRDARNQGCKSYICQINAMKKSHIVTIKSVTAEYGEGSAVSSSGDIYSLGILLLEMFTGRSQMDNIFGDSLQSWHILLKATASIASIDKRCSSRVLFALTIAAAVAAGGSSSDEDALLDFKAGFRGSNSIVLSSWNSSTSFCSREGVKCDRRMPKRVAALTLPSSDLAGELPPAIGNLSFLQSLNLSFNNLHGEIPPSLGRLQRLQTLDLVSNSFSGELPANLCSCISLKDLSLAFNKTSRWSGNKLTQLQKLQLQNNSFTGSIPASLANLTSLQYLYMEDNHLDGLIPPDLGKAAALRDLGFQRNNLSGVFPSSLWNLSALTVLAGNDNMLQGSIPANIGDKFPGLGHIGLAKNQFSGVIPSSLFNLSSLASVIFSGNKFSGFVPPTVGRLKSLRRLYLHVNRLEANNRKGWEFMTSLTNCSQLQQLVLSENSFSGQLPNSIVNLSTTLQKLYLDNNSISGSIPEDIGNLIGLDTLDLGFTSLSGVIPASIGKLANLVEVALYNTSLSGLIPSSIGNLTNLNRLYAFYTDLEGPIPASLGKLEKLFVLDLSTNRNQLSGQIPDSIGNCEVLELLQLDKNSFEGGIPQSLTNLKGLNILNLTLNKLSGRIPDTIGRIANLQQLFLAQNNFSGPIPATLQNLTMLWKLDVSFNNLQGKVPDEGVFKNLTYASVAGNNELCGGIPQLHLAPCPILDESKNKKQWSKKLKQRQNSQATFPGADEQYHRVSYYALARGSNEFSEGNLLGKGSYGSVYRCTLEDEGAIVAVKVFNLQKSGSAKRFEVECDALRRVRHRCLIKIITCCSSINPQGQEFKALVFEYMPNGSLDGWLHPTSSNPTPSNTLSLSQRLNIVVDILDALDYLHNHCQPLIIHCDLKPSNILLAEDMSAKVGDFGISKILPGSIVKTLQNSNSTVGIRGSIGYIPPEYGEGSAVSRLGDIYSLGILLLEIFTGRSPTDDMFKDSVYLHKYVWAAFPDGVLEIADQTIWLHEEANNNDVTDASITRGIIQECLVSVFRLGISCSKQQAKERMLLADAVSEMHAIRNEYLDLLSQVFKK
uniref:Receptor kinase-like protein Xa21 n=1 Tax=Leersia perrieri TaxID=77586 RepID=A0A0D9UWT9_9ORYZ